MEYRLAGNELNGIFMSLKKRMLNAGEEVFRKAHELKHPMTDAERMLWIKSGIAGYTV